MPESYSLHIFDSSFKNQFYAKKVHKKGIKETPTNPKRETYNGTITIDEKINPIEQKILTYVFQTNLTRIIDLFGNNPGLHLFNP